MGSPTKQTNVRRALKAAKTARRRAIKIRKKVAKLKKAGKLYNAS